MYKNNNTGETISNSVYNALSAVERLAYSLVTEVTSNNGLLSTAIGAATNSTVLGGLLGGSLLGGLTGDLLNDGDIDLF